MNKNISKIILLSTSLLLTSCGNKISYKENLDKYIQEMNYRDDFTIVQFSDIHWGTGTPELSSEDYMRSLIAAITAKKGKIDLLVLNGDLFMLSNSITVKKLLTFMDSLNIPYATTWGNHDRHGEYNPNWLSTQFKNAKNSLYLEPDNDDVYGRSNYVVNLKDGDDVKWQIGLIDSGASYSENGVGFFRDYDYVRQSQADWFVEENKEAGNPKALAFYHIPQYEFANSYQEGTGKFFCFEEFANSDTNNGIFIDSVTKNGVDLKGVFSAHAHSNDWTTTLNVNGKSVDVGFGVKSTYELYYAKVAANDATANALGINEEFDLVGASVMTLHDDSYDLDHVYYNKRANNEVFEKWVRY